MSVTRRTGKSGTRWIARVSHRGQREVCKTFARKTDAQAWEQSQKAKCAGDQTFAEKELKGRTLLKDFCTLWHQKHCIARNAESTARSSAMIIAKHIAPALGGIQLANLDIDAMESWHISLVQDKGLSPKTANNCLGCLKKILNDACRWRYLDRNPAHYVPSLRCQESEPTFWTQDEAISFIGKLKEDHPQFLPVFCLALYTGMRKGEIQGLKWDCVDLNSKTILVKRVYCKVVKDVLERTKGGRSRRIPMNPALHDIFVHLRCASVGDGLVFSQSFPWNHTHRIIRSVCAESGTRVIKFHDLRHSFASNLVMKDRPLYEVQKLLGHADFRMTQKYAHLSPNHLRGATDCLDFRPLETEKTCPNVVSLSSAK